MRLLNKQFAALSLIGVLVLPMAAVHAQTAVPPAANSPRAGSPEVQQPLDVERDPIVSPDEADDIAVKPDALGTAGAQGKQRNDIDKADGRYTLRRDVQEVVLNATVLDDQGHLVNDLTKDDFHVFEDGVAQAVASFQHSDTPVSMGIMVDNSGSMRDKRSAVNQAALNLVRASNPKDEVFVVNFNDEFWLDQDFTSNVSMMKEA